MTLTFIFKTWLVYWLRFMTWCFTSLSALMNFVRITELVKRVNVKYLNLSLFKPGWGGGGYLKIIFSRTAKPWWVILLKQLVKILIWSCWNKAVTKNVKKFSTEFSKYFCTWLYIDTLIKALILVFRRAM